MSLDQCICAKQEGSEWMRAVLEQSPPEQGRDGGHGAPRCPARDGGGGEAAAKPATGRGGEGPGSETHQGAAPGSSRRRGD